MKKMPFGLSDSWGDMKAALDRLRKGKAIIVLDEEGEPVMALTREQGQSIAAEVSVDTPMRELQQHSGPLLIVEADEPLEAAIAGWESIRELQEQSGAQGVVLVGEEIEWLPVEELRQQWALTEGLVLISGDHRVHGDPVVHVLRVRCRYQECGYINKLTGPYDPDNPPLCQNPSLPKHDLEP